MIRSLGRFGLVGRDQVTLLFNGDVIGDLFSITTNRFGQYVRVNEQQPQGYILSDVRDQVVRILRRASAEHSTPRW